MAVALTARPRRKQRVRAPDLADRPLVAIIGQLGFVYTGRQIFVCIWNADGIQHLAA